METLSQICLKYVANNIHCVESLIDFPEIVGEMLAAAVSARVNISPDRRLEKCVGLFTKAYGNKALRSLNLAGSADLVCDPNRVVDNLCKERRESLLKIIASAPLEQLDVSYCNVFCYTEWLSMLGQSSLTHLSLRGVGLNDLIFTFLTTCATIRHRGLDALRYLDVSENELSARILPKIARFSRLEVCNVTHTLIRAHHISATGIAMFSREDSILQEIKSSGWLALHIQDMCSSDTTSRFYRKHDPPFTNPCDGETLVFVRTSSEDQLRARRKRTSINPNAIEMGQLRLDKTTPHSKRVKTSVDDEGILSLYT